MSTKTLFIVYDRHAGATYSEDDAKGIKNNKDIYSVNFEEGTITATDSKDSYEIQLVGIGTKRSSTTD